MKRIVAVLLLLVLTVGLLASCGKEENAPDGMKNVAAENDKFYFYVPTTWVEKEHGATSPNADGSNVLLTTQLLSKGHTPDTFWQEECVPTLSATFDELEIIEDRCGTTVLGGVDAGKYVYRVSLAGNNYWYMDVFAVYGNFVYRLTYTATAENFETHLADVELMCSEFVFR